MEKKIDTRRILLFLALSFGIAWIIGLIIYLNGGLSNSPEVAPGISLAILLLAIPYMWAPALANLLTRLLTGEGRQNMYLRLDVRRNWRYWLAGWVLPGFMTIAGAALFFLIFPQNFDAGLSIMQQASGSLPPALAKLSPWGLVLVQTLMAMLVSPLVNGLAVFGEELGWRAYLLPKLLPLGWKKALLWMGLIWGVWHWPVILMGYEYGSDYAGFPWPGMLLFIWIAFCLGVFLSWMTVRSGSVYAAVIGHAAINGIAALPVIALVGDPNPLLGPLPVGLIGSAAYAALALLLFFSPGMNENRRQLVVPSEE